MNEQSQPGSSGRIDHVTDSETLSRCFYQQYWWYFTDNSTPYGASDNPTTRELQL